MLREPPPLLLPNEQPEKQTRRQRRAGMDVVDDNFATRSLHTLPWLGYHRALVKKAIQLNHWQSVTVG
jgi:hypothetical protein